jgi:mono/diheme cytochrome c family protein
LASHTGGVRSGRGVIVVMAALFVVAVSASGYWYAFVRSVPVRYTDPVQRYQYGSLGSEVDSIPFAMWLALPDVCPDRLPRGYASLGFIFEPGQEQPIGISRRSLGVERMGVNCAGCHTGAVREAPGAPQRVIPGMPNEQLDFERYIQFLIGCLRDPRLTGDAVVAAMRRHHPVSAVEALVYRTIVVPQARREAEKRAAGFDWYADRPPFGPGRLDTPNSLKRLLNVPITPDSVGTVELPAVWNQAARTTRWRHWDGNSPSVAERDHITALITGATESSMDQDEVAWIEGWLSTLAPPKYPFPIDASRAARGETIFARACAACHVARAGDVTPIAIVATDRARLDAISTELITRLNEFGSGRPGITAHYRKTDGYSNVLLDGIWARAPYLHNGSVPNLAELLEPAAQRSRVFYTGSDVYDQVHLGFIVTGPDAEKRGFRFDTSVRGNGNGGHEFGTDLSADEKKDLLQYLKRL